MGTPLSPHGDRDGRETLLLVGGSSDIGASLLRLLDGRAMTVIATCNRSARKLEALAGELRTLTVVPRPVDLGDAGAVRRLADELGGEHPMPGKVVLLAAPKLRTLRFREAAWSDFQAEIDVQLRAATLLLQRVLPGMADRRRGSVVFVLSSAAWNVPPVGMAHYVTAKYALRGLMKALAAEYAARGVRINAVSPSMVDTAFLEELPQRFPEIIAAQSPLRRNATPGEVASVIEFLLSDASSYMTGADIPLAGGAAF